MSEMLYEGEKVCLSRHAGPAREGPDRRRYQLTLMQPHAGMGAGEPVAAAWVTLTRRELSIVAGALYSIHAIERPA